MSAGDYIGKEKTQAKKIDNKNLKLAPKK